MASAGVGKSVGRAPLIQRSNGVDRGANPVLPVCKGKDKGNGGVMRPRGTAISLSFAAMIALSPFAVSTAAAQDCVRTVRAISDFTIRGDAWTWWNHAAGVYDRESHPAIGSVLVFKRTGHMRRGHVSLVSAVIDRRTIEVDHTWINGDGIRRGMRVVDVSRNNDWSSVRVWHEPTDQMGMRVYASYGFIMPEGEGEAPKSRALDAGDRGMDTDFSVAPSGRSKAHTSGPRLMEASLNNAHRAMPSLKPRVAVAHAVTAPGRKPQAMVAAVPVKATSDKAERVDVAAVTPHRKPNLPSTLKNMVASVDGLRTLMPNRKPGSVSVNAVAELVDDEH